VFVEALYLSSLALNTILGHLEQFFEMVLLSGFASFQLLQYGFRLDVQTFLQGQRG
jgi:hypothetical protein